MRSHIASGDDRPDAYAVFSTLVGVQTTLWNAVDAKVREQHELPLTLMTALLVAASTQRCRVRDLVDTLHITVGGASKVVDRMVAAGLVTRVRDDRDRRSPVLVPTAEGRALLAAASPTIEEILQDQLVQRLSTADLTALERILGRLIAPSEQPTGEGS